MNPNDVIDAYVGDVVRRVPGKQRDGIGLELRGLLGEMLEGRAADAGRPADDAMVLAMLREFGTPAEVAARYLSPGMVLIPAAQTRSYVLTALVGVAVQWALTLPQVFNGSMRLVTWWFGWGLGALWWPGFLMMMAIIGAGFRYLGWFRPTWRPRVVDPDRVQRGPLALGMAAIAAAAFFMVCLPWLVPRLPGVLPQVLAFDPGFLRTRAWPAPVLWIAQLALLAKVYAQGRWSPLLQRMDLALSVAAVAMLVWWLLDGRMFVADATDAGARGALAFVILVIVLSLAFGVRRRRTTWRLPAEAR